MKKILMILMLASFALALSACNTVHGFGKDVQKAGEKVEEVSNK